MAGISLSNFGNANLKNDLMRIDRANEKLFNSIKSTPAQKSSNDTFVQRDPSKEIINNTHPYKPTTIPIEDRGIATIIGDSVKFVADKIITNTTLPNRKSISLPKPPSPKIVAFKSEDHVRTFDSFDSKNSQNPYNYTDSTVSVSEKQNSIPINHIFENNDETNLYTSIIGEEEISKHRMLSNEVSENVHDYTTLSMKEVEIRRPLHKTVSRSYRESLTYTGKWIGFISMIFLTIVMTCRICFMAVWIRDGIYGWINIGSAGFQSVFYGYIVYRRVAKYIHSQRNEPIYYNWNVCQRFIYSIVIHLYCITTFIDCVLIGRYLSITSIELVEGELHGVLWLVIISLVIMFIFRIIITTELINPRFNVFGTRKSLKYMLTKVPKEDVGYPKNMDIYT